MAVLKFLDTSSGKREWNPLQVVTDGISWIPTVSEDGYLTWSNTGYMPNPEPVLLRPAGIQMYNTKAQFPAIIDTNENGLYVDKSTGAIYRADKTQGSYVPLSATGSAQTIVFVTTLPSVADAEVGVIYALKKDDGSFELWAKNNGVWEMVDGSDTANKEILSFNSYTDFPTVGSVNCIYVSTSDNLTYRWDDVKKTYITVGDKARSVEAGQEEDSEVDEINADEVKNMF